MKKKVLYLALVALVILIFAGLILVSVLDTVIREGIESNGSRITGTTVTVESVDFSVFSGEGAITDMRILNPEGFSEGPALVLGKILFKAEMDSLSMDLVTLARIEAASAEILPEKNGEGKMNFQVLSQNLDEAANTENPEVKDTGTWTPDLKIWRPRFKVTEFILGEGSVNLSGLGYDLKNLKTPEFRLQNLGGPDGATPGGLMEEILSGLYSEIIRHTIQSGIRKWLDQNIDIPDAVKDFLGID